MRPTLAGIFAAICFVKAQSPVYGQCGGTGWAGPTNCATGSTCTFASSFYSQCLPTATSLSSDSDSQFPFLGGVNTAGYDFGVATDGSFAGAGATPPLFQFEHFASQSANLFRIPFAWQLMTPSVGGSINASFFAQFDTTVQAALATGAHVILDLHNYARWYGAVIGQGGPSNDQYASLWTQLATKYAGTSRIVFGIMNEPHDLPQGTRPWAASVQAAVNAIRAAGATSQMILIPGSSWSSAQALPTEAGPDLLNVTDPIGDPSLLVFDVHKYLDFDSSGTHAECVTDNIGVLTTLVSWLQSNGNRKALLSETGGGNTASCQTNLKAELAFVKSQSKNLVGFSVWSAGAFSPDYTLAMTPNQDGSDQPLWVQAVQPNL